MITHHEEEVYGIAKFTLLKLLLKKSIICPAEFVFDLGIIVVFLMFILLASF